MTQMIAAFESGTHCNTHLYIKRKILNQDLLSAVWSHFAEKSVKLLPVLNFEP